MLDGMLLVMESERTNPEAALRAKQRLIHANARFLGVILNKHRQHLPSWLDARL
jgi:Mrp family chromosome partitioning ATPase